MEYPAHRYDRGGHPGRVPRLRENDDTNSNYSLTVVCVYNAAEKMFYPNGEETRLQDFACFHVISRIGKINAKMGKGNGIRKGVESQCP